MADNNDSWLTWVIIAAIGFGGYYYFKSDDKATPAPIYSNATMSAAEAAVEGANTPLAPPQPVAPKPRYEAVENGVYYYVPAATEEERKNGLLSGEAIGFRYFGKSDEGAHVLVSINRDGTPVGLSSCAVPCKLIKYESGKRVPYNSSTVIGSAFEDAMRGFLKSTKPKLRPIPQQEYQEAPAVFEEPPAVFEEAPVTVTGDYDLKPETPAPVGE